MLYHYKRRMPGMMIAHSQTQNKLPSIPLVGGEGKGKKVTIMASRLIVTLFLLPLLFIPAFSTIYYPAILDLRTQRGFRGGDLRIHQRFKGGGTGDLEKFLAGFEPQHPTTETSTLAVTEGNDGGLAGDVGTKFDTLDMQWGADEEAKADPVNDRASKGHKDDLQTNYGGKWELVSASSGVSAMHMQLMTNNKALIFDSTVLGPSAIKLAGNRPCPIRPPNKDPDCWAHAVIYDIETAQLRPLNINTDPWCSSGGLGVDGRVVSTGGFTAGSKSIRFISPCDTCDWEDTPNVLGDGRWYATQVKLEDGSFIVVGGRQSYSYERVPVNGVPNNKAIFFPFLKETSDLDENNLYPFVHLLPDGNVFIFANSRSILLDPKTNKIIKEYPRLHGGSRNYPASGMSALLPLVLEGKKNSLVLTPEVIICGGAKPKAYRAAGKNQTYLPALQDCARLKVLEVNAKWQVETMPSRRVMGDMLILPTGDLLMLNGAQRGTSAWQYAKDPNFTPVVYSPTKPVDQRFKQLQAGTIPRMYHSTSMVLPDGRILVGGSNTNPFYQFKNVEFPTELRMEKFSPHYLDPALQGYRPVVVVEGTDKKMAYNGNFNIKFKIDAVKVAPRKRDLKVTIYAPPFTTHGWSMGQRLVQLGITNLVYDGAVSQLTTKAPPKGSIAPPGFYLAFVVYRGIPSVGVWVQVQ